MHAAAVLVLSYGVLAALLGVAEATSSSKRDREQRRSWLGAWIVYGCVGGVLLVIILLLLVSRAAARRGATLAAEISASEYAIPLPSGRTGAATASIVI